MARRRNPLSVLYFIDERTCGESRMDLQVWKNGANDSTAGSARSIDFISLSPSCITGCQPVLRGNFEVYPSVCAAQKHVARQNQRLGLRTAPTTERCHLNANPAGYIWWLHAKIISAATNLYQTPSGFWPRWRAAIPPVKFK